MFHTIYKQFNIKNQVKKTMQKQTPKTILKAIEGKKKTDYTLRNIRKDTGKIVDFLSKETGKSKVDIIHSAIVRELELTNPLNIKIAE